MAQYTVYENQNEDSRESYPYFVDVQHDLLDSLNSRLVIPLAPSRDLAGLNITTLCPKAKVENEVYMLLTHQMTNVPQSALKAPVTSFAHLRDEIIAAIDFLITGV